jgi:hypothetical protein
MQTLVPRLASERQAAAGAAWPRICGTFSYSVMRAMALAYSPVEFVLSL